MKNFSFDWPWSGGSKIVTLSCMEKFLLPDLYDLKEIIKKLEDQSHSIDFKKHLDNIEERCSRLNLEFTCKQAKMMQATLSRDDIKLFESEAKELFNRFKHEMENISFFYICSSNVSKYYNGSFINDNIKEFCPTIDRELLEAGKCFAFARYTACIFHLMRALEIPLERLALHLTGQSLNLKNSDRSWGTILNKKIKPYLNDKNLEYQKDPSFFDDAHAYLEAIKKAWRNPTMHIEAVYTEERATEIFNAVLPFLNEMAEKLKE